MIGMYKNPWLIKIESNDKNIRLVSMSSSKLKYYSIKPMLFKILNLVEASVSHKDLVHKIEKSTGFVLTESELSILLDILVDNKLVFKENDHFKIEP